MQSVAETSALYVYIGPIIKKDTYDLFVGPEGGRTQSMAIFAAHGIYICTVVEKEAYDSFVPLQGSPPKWCPVLIVACVDLIVKEFFGLQNPR